MNENNNEQIGDRSKDKFPNDLATNEWLNALKKSTKASYQTMWKYFLEYVGMTGDQILANRKTDKEYAWEKKTLGFKQWLIESKKQASGSAVAGITSVRSFFAYHRLGLEFRNTEKAKLTESRRVQEDYRFSKDDLKKMCDHADLTEKYIITVGKSFGLRAGDFIGLRRGDLEAYIDREPPISIGELCTQKENVTAFPFIDTDAKPIIKMFLEQMDRDGRTDANERILKYRDEIQLSRILLRVAGKAGIKYGNKNIRFHCLRKFLIDHLSNYMSESKWKQIVGKTIAESAYVSPDMLREDYQRAMGETTYAKSVEQGDIELMAKKQALIMLAKLQGITENQMKTIFRQKSIFIGRQLNIKDEVDALEEATDKETENAKPKPKGCTDGKHCQRIIEESELPVLLNEGYYFVATLPSGKIVVSND
jgi:integrase